MTFSEARVVSALIRNRIKLDNTYNEKCYPGHLLSSSGEITFSEPVITTYIDLDRLIEKAKMTNRQRKIVELVMRGWTIQDVADEYGLQKQNVLKCFQAAVDKIVDENNRKYREFLTKESPAQAPAFKHWVERENGKG